MLNVTHRHTWRAPCGSRNPQKRPLLQSCPHRRSRCSPIVTANKQDTDGRTERATQQKDQLIIGASAVSLALLATLCLTVWRDPIEDIIYSDAFNTSEFGLGDIVGGLLWGCALYFTSPLQLLLLFLGRIDTERPSDGILRQLGLAAGLKVDDVGYSAPASLRVATAALCLVGGLATAWLFSSGLGDATWAVSTGIGACIAAGVYEVGRPTRLSPQQAQLLESQWQDFAKFASQRLQKVGRCHESEVFGAFRKQFAKYRQADVISDAVLRDMVRNWHPDAERTPNGFYKNVSLVAHVDPFTGELAGYQAPTAASQSGASPSGSSSASQSSSSSSSSAAMVNEQQ